ncbi:AAA family ATPase [Nocardia puris]|uniref:AAA domain-containing protein n=1 Tax=Nocardia puris TaxID=208602 RepID=A0A366CW80_9NOCA|nr:AAA family ATPase [Nocardia puris]RBO82080.1 AAA domain-containing protein [Nocardia puris]
MLYVVIGPPAAGKSTWCREHARPGDIVIDYDRIALALNPDRDPDSHDHPNTIKTVTKAARQAAIDKALTLAHQCDVFIIHSTPSAQLLARYRTAGADIVTIDPGKAVVMERAKAERPWWMHGAIKKWYDQQDDQPQQTRRSEPRTAKRRRTTVERGYGQQHRKLREALAPTVRAGKAVCWRCQERIHPTEPWDLGHDDHDRRKYRGPEHVTCNRAAGARSSGRHRKSSGPKPRSREW